MANLTGDDIFVGAYSNYVMGMSYCGNITHNSSVQDILVVRKCLITFPL